jgi:hypothetical protein
MTPPYVQAPSRNFDIAASVLFAHLPPWMFDAVWDPFFYTTGLGPAAVGALAAGLAFPVQIESTSHFVCCATSMVATDQAAPPNLIAFPLVLASLAISGGGFMPGGQFVPVTSIFGTGQLPYIWPVAKLVEASQQFTVTLTNLANQAMNLYLVFHGFRVPVK